MTTAAALLLSIMNNTMQQNDHLFDATDELVVVNDDLQQTFDLVNAAPVAVVAIKPPSRFGHQIRTFSL